MPCTHAKIRLKSAPQKVNFVMAKAISKSYTLDCNEINNIIFSKNYWKLGKMDPRFWKDIKNKGKVTLWPFWRNSERNSEKLVRNILFTRVNYNNIKHLSNEYVMWTCFRFLPMKNIFWKLKANTSLIIVCLQIY